MIYTYAEDKPNWRGGERFVVLYHRGRKWIRLLDTATLEIYKRPVSCLPALRPYRIAPKTMAGRLVTRRAAFRRCGVAFPKRAVESAIKSLRGAEQSTESTTRRYQQ